MQEEKKETKHTSWKNEPTLKDLMKDFDSSQSSFENQKSMVEDSVGIMNEDRSSSSKNIVSGRETSGHNSQLVRKQYEWIVPNIEEPVLGTDTMFALSPLDYVSSKSEAMNANILNYQWNNQLRRNELINQSARKFVEEGMCVLKVGWSLRRRNAKVFEDKPVYSRDKIEIENAINIAMSKDESIGNRMIEMYQAGQAVPVGTKKVSSFKNIVFENKPVITVLDYDKVIIDPSSKGKRDNVNFVIEICETSYSDLVKQKSSYFNLEHIRDNVLNNESDDDFKDSPYVRTETYDEEFEFSDVARKKITMYVYWGYWDIAGDGKLEPIVAAWVGTKMIRLEKSPYPFYDLPYTFGAFLPEKNSFIGRTNANLLESDQDALTNTIRAMQDITDESATGQEFINEDMFATPLEKKAYERGETVYLKRNANPKDMIHRKSIEPVPDVLFQMKEMYEVNSINMTGAVDGDALRNRIVQSPTGLGVPLDSASNRENAILRRFTTMFSDASKLILSMNKAYLQRDSIYRVGDEFKLIGETDNLSDMFEVKSQVETRRVQDDKASKLITMLHNGASSMSERLAAQHYLKIAQLWNFKDLSHMIEEDMNREPTEEEQVMRQLEMERIQLENKKMKMDMLLKAKEIEFTDSKMREILVGLASGSIDADILKTKAQTELYLAESDKMDSQIQLFNQEFQLIGDGTKREEKKEDNEYKHLADLEREEVRTDRELKNIEKKQEKSSKQESLDYIKNGTLHNSSGYDATDDIFRRILDKNSLDTKQYTEPKKEITDADITDLL